MGHRPLRCDTTLPAATSTLFDTAYAEAVDDLLQNWSKGLKFVLPDFHVISEFLDHIEWRNTNAIFIFPEWSKACWWPWLAVVRAWARLLRRVIFLATNRLRPNNEICFSGPPFHCRTSVLELERLTLSRQVTE